MTRPAGSTDEVVHVEGLWTRYRTVDVLQDVSFGVERGELVALLGPNGAGKTTTVEILEGFRRPSAGVVRVLDADPSQADQAWRARTGVVLQSWRDHSRWRVREFIAYQASFYAPYQRGPSTNVDRLLAAVGLVAQANIRIGALSGGQRRRLDLAVGIVGSPELLFLDEPTSGLDPEARRDFHDLLTETCHDAGTSVLLTTHDLEEADRLADRLLVLVDGKMIAQGTTEELRHEIVGPDEVRWTVGTRRFAHRTTESTAFVRSLFANEGDAIEDLEVRRASLEDTYLELVRRAEASPSSAPEATPRSAA